MNFKIDEELKDIIPSFIDNRIENLKDLITFLEKEEFKNSKDELHKLKGLFGSFGFDILYKRTLEAETLLKENKYDMVLGISKIILNDLKTAKIIYV